MSVDDHQVPIEIRGPTKHFGSVGARRARLIGARAKCTASSAPTARASHRPCASC